MTSSDDLVPTAACMTCGVDAGTGQRFCRNCGAPLPGALPPPNVAGPPSDAVTTHALSSEAVAARARVLTEVPSEASERVAPRAGPPRGDEPLPTDRVGRFVQPQTRPSDGVPCPACPTVNLHDRELCVSCGIDLETGAVLPQPRPGSGEGGSNGSRLSPVRHRAWWVAPVAIVGVAGAILAGLWAAGIGPFASEPELPAADFVAERYPVDDDPEPLLLSDIATLTTRPPEGERTFPVEQMVDTDPETAWHSNPGDLPTGVDEKVDLFLEEPAWVAKLVINNGDHADAAAYAATGRVQRAAVVMDGDVRMEVVLLDLGREPQAVRLPEPVLTTTVRLEILETLPGGASESLAISDLELRGWVADPADADLAVERADVRQAAGSFTLPD